MEQRHIRIEDFNYELPDERIAKYPLEERDQSQLLIWDGVQPHHQHFYDLPDLLHQGDVLIYNNTKVIQARLHFAKETGALIEIFCLEPHTPSNYEEAFAAAKEVVWQCMVGNLKKWKQGILSRNFFINDIDVCLQAEYVEEIGGMSHLIRFTWNKSEFTFAQILEACGELPIPPYLNRETEDKDKETYQTVYSKIEGSVAAPTAGLHFTLPVLRRLARNGVREEEITLHVGAGTFHPVKSEEIGDHPMHTEFISINKETIELLLNNREHIVAVGTTSVRTLESLYYLGVHIANNPEAPNLHVEQWEPYEPHTLTTQQALQAILDYLNQHHLWMIEASTQILIVPGFEFRVVSRMLTNFHQPKSTLLLLVAAFVGIEHWKTIYNYALSNNFRFLSYGDSSLLTLARPLK
ncbi:MAG: S-adenosylmethionine:tRNA ribosyltransferase-isomerase [Bacteroidales bacterium]|nr:S-adenosylmethionine:tRNA ribosyltransferase-isomerase [Bacteroidales bacterium]